MTDHQRTTRPTRRAKLAVAAALALAGAAALGGCNDDPQPAPTSADKTVATPASTGPSTTLASTSLVVTTIATVTEDSDAQVNPTAATIDVMIGEDDGPDRLEQVAKGAEVQLNITNPTADDEYHVHGYDLEFGGKKDAMATLNFTADKAGRFEVESHKTGKVLLIIEVK